MQPARTRNFCGQFLTNSERQAAVAISGFGRLTDIPPLAEPALTSNANFPAQPFTTERPLFSKKTRNALWLSNAHV